MQELYFFIVYKRKNCPRNLKNSKSKFFLKEVKQLINLKSQRSQKWMRFVKPATKKLIDIDLFL